MNSLSQIEQNRENHTLDMLSIERDRQEIPERIDVKIFKNDAATARGPAAPDTPGEDIELASPFVPNNIDDEINTDDKHPSNCLNHFERLVIEIGQKHS
jgi:hypothetical protein